MTGSAAGSNDGGGFRSYLRDCLRLLPYVKPYWKLALASISMIGFGALVSIVAPWPLAILLDTVFDSKPLPSLLGPLLDGTGRTMLIVIAVVFGLEVTAAQHSVTVLDNYVNTKLAQRLVLDFRSDLFRHVQKLSRSYHDESSSGLLFYRMSNEADAAGVIVVAVPPLIQAVLTLGLMFAIAFKLDTELALISLAVVPFIYYSAGYYAKRIQPRLYDVRNLEGETLSILSEALAMLRVVVAFVREDHEYRRFRAQGEDAVAARVRLTVLQTIFSLAVSMITAMGTAAVLGVGALHVIDGRLTPGELMVMLGYIAAIYRPLEQISNTFSTLQEYVIYLRYALGLLDTEPEVKDIPGAVPLERARGAIQFERVCFRYSERETTLEDISFHVAPGQRVAVVGPTGAGKTTLVSLIPRFYDAAEGHVLVDGTDVRGLTLASLREQISFVHQEPLLFAGTIAENIRYGRLDATWEEVENAARAANAHDFIVNLPLGYETKLGERGAKLSGGERQRICIARSFIKDAPILILDEPTSSVDSKTEAAILEALERLMARRTTLLIAHRLSTIKHVDLIVVLSHGRLVESGSHEELIQANGLYRQLWQFQTGVEARERSTAAAEEEELVRFAQSIAARVAGSDNGSSSELAGAIAGRLAGRAATGDAQAEAAWLVIGALLPLLEHGNDHALRELASQSSDSGTAEALAGGLAAGLFRDLGEQGAR
jgi:ABC-type multidrug transport system fused ATPase/permease subunit